MHPMARIVGAPTLFQRPDCTWPRARPKTAAAANPSYSCCTFRGSVAALDIGSGRTVWKSYTVLRSRSPPARAAPASRNSAPPAAAISCVAHHRQQSAECIVCRHRRLHGPASEQSLTDAVVAFDLGGQQAALGQANWFRPDAGNGPGPVHEDSPFCGHWRPAIKKVLLAGQKSGVVYGLDPDHGGDILWQDENRRQRRVRRRRRIRNRQQGRTARSRGQPRRGCLGERRGPPQSLCRHLGLAGAGRRKAARRA